MVTSAIFFCFFSQLVGSFNTVRRYLMLTLFVGPEAIYVGEVGVEVKEAHGLPKKPFTKRDGDYGIAGRNGRKQ